MRGAGRGSGGVAYPKNGGERVAPNDPLDRHPVAGSARCPRRLCSHCLTPSKHR